MIRRCVDRIISDGHQMLERGLPFDQALLELARVHQLRKQQELGALAGIEDHGTRLAMEVRFRQELGARYQDLIGRLIGQGQAEGRLELEDPDATAAVLLQLYFTFHQSDDPAVKREANRVAALALGLPMVDLGAFSGVSSTDTSTGRGNTE